MTLENASDLKATIKVIGVGGGGGNALNTMIDANLTGVEFIVANTDAQALEQNSAGIKIQLGTEVTRGLGCGANPEKGRAAAMEDRDKIREILTGSDMVFVTAGLGGGTGTGAAPVIAEIAKEIGALTVAVVTKPFQFEGRVRAKHAELGMEELHGVVDTLITIPNHRLLALAGRDTSIQDAFRIADDVLLDAVRGISDLITVPGLMNLDFADVQTIMNEMGTALMGTGVARSENRAVDAAQSAISSPLLENLSIEGARGVLINITGGSDLSLFEVNEASMLIQESAHEDANIIVGAVTNNSLPDGEIRVTVIATGLNGERPKRRKSPESGGTTSTDYSNVTQLRREATEAAPTATAATRSEAQGNLLETAVPEAAPAAPKAEKWVSPFEDELDVPTFLRQTKEGKSEEDSHELPAFLRRSAD